MPKLIARYNGIRIPNRKWTSAESFGERESSFQVRYDGLAGFSITATPTELPSELEPVELPAVVPVELPTPYNEPYLQSQP